MQDVKELKHGIIMYSWLRFFAKLAKGYQADIICELNRKEPQYPPYSLNVETTRLNQLFTQILHI